MNCQRKSFYLYATALRAEQYNVVFETRVLILSKMTSRTLEHFTWSLKGMEQVGQTFGPPVCSDCLWMKLRFFDGYGDSDKFGLETETPLRKVVKLGPLFESREYRDDGGCDAISTSVGKTSHERWWRVFCIYFC